MAEPTRNNLFSSKFASLTPAELWVRSVHILAAVLGLAALVLEYGFIRPDRDTGLPLSMPPFSVELLRIVRHLAIAGFIVAFWSDLILVPKRKTFVREHIVEIFTSLAAAVVLVLVLAKDMFLTNEQTAALMLGLTIYLVVQILIGFVKFNTWIVGTMEYPARAIIFGFGMVILIGALLLSLPCASYMERFPDFGNNFVDHLFTSTSAVCVTGLNVRDTITYYTPFGQVVIALLIQAGGLGIIIFGTIFALLLGRQISIQEASLVKDIYSQETVGQMGKIVKFVIVSTLLIEGIGAALLYPMWTDCPSVADRVFKSCFHAISAFCNAGFALQTDNLISYARNWQTYGVIASLIIIGGLGFPVLSNLYHVAKFRLFGIVSKRRMPDNLEHFRMTTLTLQSKVVLVTTTWLILGGMLVMFLIETPWTKQHRWGRDTQYEDTVVRTDAAVMRNHGPFQRMLDAYFLSVTARTAGFNAVDISSGKLHPATVIVLITLMFVGGSPASTAGGIKTVTFVILLAAVATALRQRPNVEMFRRTIDPGIIRRAVVMLLVYAAVVWAITTALVLTHPQINYLDLLFESTSACGTVGLSTGVTPYLNLVGRLLIILGMYAGRLGPLTLLIAMAGSPRTIRYEYPREGLITG